LQSKDLEMEKNNKKVINAWCSYDIANSVYNLIITATLFPIYYQEVTQEAFNSDTLSFFGFNLKNTVLYDYTLSAAYFVIIFLSPILSGIADYGGFRKRFMQFFTTLGAFSCFMLYWFSGTNLYYGLIFAALAVIGFAGSLVFYNSFLPIIATPDKHDRISAKGFSWGYAGSIVLLIINLLMIFNYQFFGFEGKLDALRFSFIAVGIWWIGVAQIAFYYLKDYPGNINKFSITLLTKGHKELLSVFTKFKHQPVIKPFLLAFFFLSMGVQTIMLVATMFGKVELKIESTNLIITIIILQILGIAGSLLFAEVSARKGNKISLSIMLTMWIGICIIAYFIQTATEFYFLAAAVGLIMGGIQSQSRSTYAKLIPENTIDTASYFSFYDITEKLAIVLGLFLFGFIEHITGSMRISAISLTILFIISLIILSFIQLPRPTKNHT
jgi:MFS transporter, UMF1 family